MGPYEHGRSMQSAEGDNTLGQALGNFLESSGIASLLKYPALSTAWEQVAGPGIAAHTRVYAFHRGRLEIAVDSSALMNEIEFNRNVLLNQIRRNLKKPFVSNIMFVLREPFSKDNDQA